MWWIFLGPAGPRTVPRRGLLGSKTSPRCTTPASSTIRRRAARPFDVVGADTSSEVSAAIFIVSMKISDHLRTQAIADYLRGDMTQQQVCAAFEARTGRRLSARTLRSWLASTGPGPDLPARNRDRLLRALRQVQVVQAEIEAVIAELDEPGIATVPTGPGIQGAVTLPPAAEPAAQPPTLTKPTTTPAAASMPAAEMETIATETPDRYDFWA